MGGKQRAAAIMNIGWIFLGCALVILALMAFTPWGKKDHVNVQQERLFGTNQRVLTGLDDFDARLVRRDEITWLLGAGRKMEAIKLYRADTGASLALARAAIERIELALSTDPLLPDEPHTPALPGDTPDAFKREVEELLLRGKKIEAIRRYREQSGLDLREARDAVELMEQELSLPGGTPPLIQYDQGVEGALQTAEEPGEAVRRALQDGRKIEAIKRYREQTGLSLREAKDAVDQMEQELFLPGATASSFQYDQGVESALQTAEEPDEAVRRALQEGRKIEAIKRYREQTGLGLRAAKDAVERLEQTLRQHMEQN
jgi:ribosomal protein L7/L12